MAYFYVYWCIMKFWIKIGHQNMWPTFWPYDLLSEIGIFWCILMYYDVLNQNGSQKHMTYFLWKWPTFRKIWKIAYFDAFWCILMSPMRIGQQNTWPTFDPVTYFSRKVRNGLFLCILMYYDVLNYNRSSNDANKALWKCLIFFTFKTNKDTDFIPTCPNDIYMFVCTNYQMIIMSTIYNQISRFSRHPHWFAYKQIIFSS